MDFIGTHGTDFKNVESIKKDNFKVSRGGNHWCGNGVYFFIDGVNSESIVDLAEKWAKDVAFDKSSKCYKYNKYAVLMVSAFVDDEFVFDLRNELTAKKCNEIRERILNKLLSKSKTMSDDEIWKYIIKKFTIDLIIKNDYIRFGISRRKGVRSRIDNCTIASIVNPNKVIDVTNIDLVKKGDLV